MDIRVVKGMVFLHLRGEGLTTNAYRFTAWRSRDVSHWLGMGRGVVLLTAVVTFIHELIAFIVVPPRRVSATDFYAADFTDTRPGTGRPYSELITSLSVGHATLLLQHQKTMSCRSRITNPFRIENLNKSGPQRAKGTLSVTFLPWSIRMSTFFADPILSEAVSHVQHWPRLQG